MRLPPTIVFVLLCLCLAPACQLQSARRESADLHWSEIARLPGGVSLRGLCAVDRSVVWASGSQGTVAKSIDGGRSWQQVGPRGSRQDFRDVHAFSDLVALVCSTEKPAVILRTEDGGRSWLHVHRQVEEQAFFDAMAFAEDGRGILFGDPIDDRTFALQTDNAGQSWQRLDKLPASKPGEAGFAASGTCAAVLGDCRWIVTGGGACRVLISTDRGATWTAERLPLPAQTDAQGAFSVAFRDPLHGVVVGGDYLDPARGSDAAAYTFDGGISWRLAADIGGYRSAVAWIGGRSWVSVGSGGSSISTDDGASWRPLVGDGYHAVACTDGLVWAVGSNGRIACLGDQRELQR